MNRVSVIIPTYNRADKIGKSIQSVLDQTHRDLELIVVDDCSTDDTEEVIKSIADDRVRYFKMPQNGGAAAARNAGARMAGSEILAFQDSDDVWRAEKIEKQLRYWEAHRDYSMIYTRFLRHDGEEEMPVPVDDVEGALEGDLLKDLLVRNTITPQTMMVDRDAFFDAGAFDEDFRCIEDWDFVIRFAEDYLIGYLDEPLVDVYYEPGGVSGNIREFLRVRVKMIEKYGLYMTQYDVMEDVFADLVWRADQAGCMQELRALLRKLPE